jgi:saccharopepsin
MISSLLQHSGNPYPVHPLDVVDTSLDDPSKCVGTFVGQSLSIGNGEL